jgi:hypothetical protein
VKGIDAHGILQRVVLVLVGEGDPGASEQLAGLPEGGRRLEELAVAPRELPERLELPRRRGAGALGVPHRLPG